MTDPIVTQMLVRTTLWSVGLAALLFGVAGTLAWPAAWVFVLGVYAVALAMGVVLARHDPALLAERLAPPFQREQARWDRVFIAGALVGYLGWMVLMALDAGRYCWSTVPAGVQVG